MELLGEVGGLGGKREREGGGKERQSGALQGEKRGGAKPSGAIHQQDCGAMVDSTTALQLEVRWRNGQRYILCNGLQLSLPGCDSVRYARQPSDTAPAHSQARPLFETLLHLASCSVTNLSSINVGLLCTAPWLALIPAGPPGHHYLQQVRCRSARRGQRGGQPLGPCIHRNSAAAGGEATSWGSGRGSGGTTHCGGVGQWMYRVSGLQVLQGFVWCKKLCTTLSNNQCLWHRQ